MSNTALQLNVVSYGNACPTSTRLSFGHSGNQSHSHNQSSYQPRSPRNTAFHRLVEDNFEELELIWDSKYQKMYGYWRPHVLDVIQKYLDCSDPQLGFARVKCSDCNTEYLLPFSCKCRGFCPSCHQRRVMEFGEYLHEEILLDIPHRQWAGRKQACCSPKHPGFLQSPKDCAHTLCITENSSRSLAYVHGKFFLTT